MDTDLLRTFVAIAETGSFSRAAAAVHRSQSAVSMQIRRLEELAGEPLFERSARGVMLTRRGEALIVEARRVLQMLDQAFAAPSGADVEGEVRIGIPEEYGASILPNVLASYAEVHPNVQITVRCGLSETFDAALERGDLDVAVVVSDPGDLRGDILFHDPIVWVESDRHALSDRDPLPLALFERGCWWRDQALAALDRTGRRYRIAYTSPSVAGIQAAVTSGLAVGVLGMSTVPDGIRTLPAESGLPRLAGSNVMVRYAALSIDQAVRRMITTIVDAFRETAF